MNWYFALRLGGSVLLLAVGLLMIVGQNQSLGIRFHLFPQDSSHENTRLTLIGVGFVLFGVLAVAATLRSG